jgi:hypothetical protein
MTPHFQLAENAMAEFTSIKGLSFIDVVQNPAILNYSTSGR